ncbi:hypothetical protein AMK11_35070 [Streptomyces sp. CB02414]|nr:hypothetical protein AMK11_35070 [Streptomyces sp. CB02414]
MPAAHRSGGGLHAGSHLAPVRAGPDVRRPGALPDADHRRPGAERFRRVGRRRHRPQRRQRLTERTATR